MGKKTIVVVGAGPGLGNHIAEEFCSHGFKAVLMARREEKLQEYVSQMKDKGMDADYQVVDCEDNASIRSAFEMIRNKVGTVDVLAYNAAVVKDGAASSIALEEFLRQYQVDVAGAVCAAQQVLPDQKKRGEGAILFTGGGLAFAPNPQYASLSMHKAALRTLALALHDEVAEANIYVGIVHVDGLIGSNERYAPARIAQEFYRIYQERHETEITY